MVETRARFLIPTRYCDDVVIETSVTEVRRSSFHLQHRLTKDGALAVEGFESRVWVVRDPDRPGRFKPQPIPAEIVARLTRYCAALMPSFWAIAASLLRCSSIEAANSAAVPGTDQPGRSR